LRDGESNLLAGLLREDERRALRGIPGILRLPVLNKLLAANDTEVRQTDIIMLLTPRIVRTHELTQADVSPIYIGTQQNLGLGGPPPLIAPTPEVPAAPAPAVPAPAPGQPGVPPGAGVIVVPPGSNTVPGTTTVPAAPSPAPTAPTPATPDVVPSGVPPTPTATGPSAVSPNQPSGGQVVLATPGPEFRIGGGPYTIPLSVVGASRLSALSLTMTFNPAALRVRAVQEGALMRTGGVNATFTQQVDAAAGRVDIAIVRPGDLTGVSGTGLLAAIVVDAIAAGPANLTITATGSAPDGTPLLLQFAPPPVVQVR
jgi:hypothetical protein